jgi:ABC-2 type transport system ATP-binding protein
MAGPPALEAHEVSHRFGGRQALADVSLTVPQGRFVALLGPNGAGKTTFFSIVTRLYASRSGSVRIFGHDLERASSIALAELGVVFQSRTLDLDLSLRQNLSYHAALHGLAGPEVHAHIAALIARADLAERIDEKIRSLSGGQARRVEIARALLHDPACLLLDEATVGLDVASRESVLAIVRTLVRERAVGVLWATHLVDEVGADDHVVLLHNGQVRFSGPVPQLLELAQAGNLRNAFMRLTENPLAEAA